MILANCNLNSSIIIEEGIANILIIENKHLFYKTIEEFIRQTEGVDGSWVLSQDSKLLPINKSANVLIDFFNIDYNHKSILTKLQSNLKELSASSEYYLDSIEIRQLIVEYIEKMNNRIFLPIEFNSDFDMLSIFKALDIKFCETSFEITGRINTYMNVMRELTGCRLTVFINLLNYLSDEDIEIFYRDIAYQKHNVLLIENRWDRLKRENEKIHIIDKDLCEVC